MRTRVKDFLDQRTLTPRRSFQYQTEKYGPWRYPADDKGVVLTWSTPDKRDRARTCFTTRRSTDAAYSDMRRLKLI